MPVDDDFEPRLGRPGAQGKARGRSFVGQVMKAANLARGGRAAGPGRRGFTGARIGRGSGVGRVLASRERFAAFRQRRVVIKSRIVRLDGAKGLSPARAHLRYIQRDGVTREGAPGRLYSAEADQADGRAFLDRQAGDRHQFRFIVSAEDRAEYEDLKPLTRRLMAQMEQDLGTKLDWVAVDHFNTRHPHTHVIVRGKDERGKDLIVAREYLTQGMRERAAELVSLDLGPRADVEIADRLRAEIGQERLTTIDRRLMRDGDVGGIVAAVDLDPFQQTLRAGRLQTLGRLGLAQDLGGGRWRLEPGFDETLKRMGERGDIVRTMQRAFTAHGIERPGLDAVIADPATMTPLVGRLVERGLSDELSDRHYLIVDAVDGRLHYVDIGRGEATDLIPNGAVVRIVPRSIEARAVDHTVAAVAEANGGRYSIDLHLRHDPSATERFAETHVRRLEAIRRITGGVERDADGGWIIAPDHVARAAAFEARQSLAEPVIVETLSSIPLDRQVGHDGATWLDRELVSAQPERLREAGFGAEVSAAKALRQRWLVEQDLAEEDQGRLVYRANLLTRLRQRELNRVAGGLSDDLGKTYVESRSGDRVEGVYRRPVELASGRYALIEKSREFTLVPWRPVLDRHLDQSVSGVIKGDGINWTIGRGRSGPTVS
ncbi:relaxase/mobilization nuclease RlxS [Brevundimonas sp. SORGH_AS_0993]|uniref:relaxase/mobilization nuclease RlxS n=1 Tax=Brevundimonas sp. SORGH_AS_0993 TaxID=3041794 RepID=UPI0027897FA4|nr:relaxase/mobilization nuclease RlxS [Brevundimonas sp. SORGH_AS_0993]MDQ1153439.1 type IV secretory pathway VirD2 relaxase [Brevundimonas sp. SORGH_AS_0993]